MTNALRAGGERLMEKVRAALSAHGLGDEVEMSIARHRVTITSRSRDVFEAEMGRPGAAPSAPMSIAAGAAAGEIVQLIKAHLRSRPQ